MYLPFKTNIVKQILYLSLPAIILSACQLQTPKSETETEAENEYVEPVVITFDESEGTASIDRNFYFLFDVSGSMDDYCAGERKIEGARTAIFKFLEKVPDDVNLGLLFLGVEDTQDGIKEVVPLGKNNKKLFREAIQNMEPSGGTPLDQATWYGTKVLIDQYKKQLGYGEYRLIIITDGLASYPYEFDEQLKNLRKYPFIALYGIGLCIEGTHTLKSYSLKYTDAHNYEELGEALEATIAELEQFDPTEFSEEDFAVDDTI